MTQIARFRHAGADHLGVVDGENYINPTRAYAALLTARGVANAEAHANAVLPADALAFFQGGEVSNTALREAVAYAQQLNATDAQREGILVPREETTTLVPIPNPPKIVCVARNYGKHAAEAGLQVSEIPILFPRFAVTQIADGEPIIVPFVSDQVDWEGELAVVIGKGVATSPRKTRSNTSRDTRSSTTCRCATISSGSASTPAGRTSTPPARSGPTSP